MFYDKGMRINTLGMGSTLKFHQRKILVNDHIHLMMEGNYFFAPDIISISHRILSKNIKSIKNLHATKIYSVKFYYCESTFSVKSKRI